MLSFVVIVVVSVLLLSVSLFMSMAWQTVLLWILRRSLTEYDAAVFSGWVNAIGLTGMTVLCAYLAFN